ncbi:hypothetical protein JOY44_07650 [Phormidium sp. CLA17]|uniref:hypothetical protein n=1 Tax=Leptolyngbya sp. Cla-17 TaxID=2803751 RepID=UPI0019343046|nr:hypothetical protein [Leptolyngbya sp. Cla-17]MBM0741489.1 hypothetical protein [Leptolyngbya sp. Cla-17]
MKGGLVAMKMWNSLTAIGFVITGLVAVNAANAAPRIGSTSQLQRLSVDLVRSDTQDFFKLGRMKLEREIQTIYEQRSQLDTGVLIIDPSIQPQPDLSPLETPNLGPLKPPKR